MFSASRPGATKSLLAAKEHPKRLSHGSGRIRSLPASEAEPQSHLGRGIGEQRLLIFRMGKNTPERQDYIIENLREDVDKQIEVAVA